MKSWVFLAVLLFASVITGCGGDKGTESNSNNPPSVPSSPLPTNNATGQSLDVTLSWQCSDPDGDNLTYDVYFGDQSAPPLAVSGSTATSYQSSSLQNNATYYWKIVAKDNDHTTEGPVWSFSTGAVAGLSTIAYGGYFSGGIVLIEADGTNKRILVPGDSVFAPKWSPDKSKIAFIKTGAYGGPGDYLIVADTAGNVDTLASGFQRIGFSGSPWSLDGFSIAFQGYPSSVYVVSVTGGPPSQVLSSATEASFLTNTEIVCAYSPSGERDSTIIVRITTSGTGLDSLAWGSAGKYFLPRVSHRRDKIAYAFLADGGNSDYNNEVWIMNTDGGSKQNVRPAGSFNGNVRGLEFNFDDAKLLFIPDTDEATSIWIADITSVTATSIPGVICLEDSDAAAWSGSANQIAFVIRESGGIAVVNEDGSGYLKIVDTLARAVDW